MTDTLDTPITPPSRPLRPSDYGTPERNWPAAIAALVLTIAAVVGAALAVLP